MRRLIKWIVIALVICPVLVIAAGLLGGGKDKPPTAITINTPVPATQAQPGETPMPTDTPIPAVDFAATQAFGKWLTSTVCAPATADSPQPGWCSKISAYQVAMNTLTVRTTANKADVPEMTARFKTFTGNNLYKQYGIKQTTVVTEE